MHLQKAGYIIHCPYHLSNAVYLHIARMEANYGCSGFIATGVSVPITCHYLALETDKMRLYRALSIHDLSPQRVYACRVNTTFERTKAVLTVANDPALRYH